MLYNYLVFSTILIMLDMIYLHVFSKQLIQQIIHVQQQRFKVNWISLVLCYLLLTLGGYYFVILKHLSALDTFFLGCFVYGIYDLTNHATFRQWRWKTVLLDTFWGGILLVSSRYLFRQIIK